jgi:hypothetical protein
MRHSELYDPDTKPKALVVEELENLGMSVGNQAGRLKLDLRFGPSHCTISPIAPWGSHYAIGAPNTSGIPHCAMGLLNGIAQWEG